MKHTMAEKVSFGGLIAALYVLLTFLADAFGLASGAVQVRISEALTILPVFTTAAVPGLTVRITGLAVSAARAGSAKPSIRIRLRASAARACSFFIFMENASL